MSHDPVFHESESWVDGWGTRQPAGWYFWDETWSDAIGPFDTEEDCRTDLKEYAEELNNTPRSSTG